MVTQWIGVINGANHRLGKTLMLGPYPAAYPMTSLKGGSGGTSRLTTQPHIS